MNAKLLTLSLLTVCLAGCESAVFVGRTYPRREPVVVYRQAPPPVVYQPAPPPPLVYQPAPPPRLLYQPAPVVVEPAPAPVYYEEGTVVGGVVVAEPPGVTDYVFMNGGYYYWHPGLRVWVHSRRPAGWRPSGGVHVYGNFSEHPAYRRGR